MVKSSIVPLLGTIEAPGVKVNLGANAVISVPVFTINVTFLFSMMGSRLRTSPGTVHAMMSASALGASSCMQETIIKPRKKQAIRFFNFIRFCF